MIGVSGIDNDCVWGLRALAVVFARAKNGRSSRMNSTGAATIKNNVVATEMRANEPNVPGIPIALQVVNTYIVGMCHKKIV